MERALYLYGGEALLDLGLRFSAKRLQLGNPAGESGWGNGNGFLAE